MTDHEPGRVLGLIQDPTGVGGAVTTARWHASWMERNRPGELDSVFIDDDTATLDFLAWLRKGTPTAERIPALLPWTHFVEFAAARRALRRRTAGAREAHVIGGVVLQGYVASGRAPTILWLGTTIRSERQSVIPFVDAKRRALYRATLPMLARVELHVLRTAQRVLVQSPFAADLVVALDVPAQRIEVVPVPVDTEAFVPGGAERSGLLFVGRAADPRKGFDRVEKALERGAFGDERVRVVSEVRPSVAAGDSRVQWLGRVEDLASEYRRAKLLLFPSRQEGLGIVAFEALACETPIVATASGGPDRWLRESGGGLVCDDEASFSSAVEALLNDDRERSEMGRRGRAWVESNMSARAFLANEDVFRL